MDTQPAPLVVWTEIPVRNLQKAVAFYNAAFGWSMEIDTNSPAPMAVLGGRMDTVGGNLYEGTPAASGSGNIVHINLTCPLEDARKAWEKAGGKISSDPVEIPYGRFVYATDPDGNTIGLFEPKTT
ncbi:VOC family protein [Aliiroseovarius crassostreae]|uniref:VOC family protein n=1 Tax=Aliiroseovarius crassostreae TaxID=154981 RepID=UPI00223B6B5E|nr:VOC family protein [Aliiroseovarius crassostreae]